MRFEMVNPDPCSESRTSARLSDAGVDSLRPPVLLGATLEELRAVARELNLPPYAAGQLAGWLYRRHAGSFDEMTDLPLRARRQLAERFTLGAYPPREVWISADGTRKYLFAAGEDRCVETAWIPDGARSTLCVSTQAGCRMRCRFCLTGRQPFAGNLRPADILNQYRSLPERERVTNLVVMGMGEPLDNWSAVRRALDVWTAPWGYALSPRRITVSTVGLLPALLELLHHTQVHVAISLHSPFEEERATWMPCERAHPIREVLRALREADFQGQRRLMFEYIVFTGLNDTPRHVRELARLLAGLRCRINLMRHHVAPSSGLPPTDEAALFRFRDALEHKGFIVTIRRSRGQDIAAACGQLSTARYRRSAAEAQRPPRCAGAPGSA
ncbi:MAG: 23S rRNA (adenine(2503)-C(2))-methyltransferase RlmN [Kiritimatiellae bacterium]|nr:23S rRNA (adenine(2503)-C(2))-methyltransferase RlmN [Kiritimatiellia bacterium]